MTRVPNTKFVKQGPPGRKAKPGKALASTAKRASAAMPTRAVNKDELRAKVEKLERANATLRAKNREANRAAKLSAARIAELGDEVARLQTQLAATPDLRSATMPNRGSQQIDPGDAVPPGVAPEDPGSPDQEAEIARENLEAHLQSE